MVQLIVKRFFLGKKYITLEIPLNARVNSQETFVEKNLKWNCLFRQLECIFRKFEKWVSMHGIVRMSAQEKTLSISKQVVFKQF